MPSIRFLTPGFSFPFCALPVLCFLGQSQPLSPSPPYPTPEDYPYKQLNNHSLRLRVYRAAPSGEETAAHPALLLVPGGGWSSPSPSLFEPFARYFPPKGVTVVLLEYRPVEDDPLIRLPDCIADVREALSYLRSQAKALGIHPEQIAILGESAGGHLAAAALLIAPEKEKLPPPSSAAGACILLNAPLDLESLPWMHSHKSLAPPPGQPANAETRRQHSRLFSPILHVKPGFPPTLLIHGEADSVVPPTQSEQFHRELLRLGNRSIFHRMPAWPHAFALQGYGSENQIAETLAMVHRFLAQLGWCEEPLPHPQPDGHAAFPNAILGDWGHFLSYEPRLHLLNPDGRSFSLTLYPMQWACTNWNSDSIVVRITDPKGHVLLQGPQPLRKGRFTVTFSNGHKGVYTVEPKGNFWLSTTLERAVLWTGNTQGHMIEDRRAVFLPVAPRRWWFWVPHDVLRFKAKAQRADRYMSQREDWGFFIVSPRGQRIAALWGQPPADRTPYLQDQEADVYVEPGAGGRFWSLEVSLGDSHNYANVNICLEGVPPYLAASPENWFNPESEQLAPVTLYEVSPFIQSARLPGMEQRWPGLKHFSPCPSLGDPDGVEVLGNARFAVWNPEGRSLGFRVGSYLPRRTKEDPANASVQVRRTDGRVLFDAVRPVLHLHEANGQPSDFLETGSGVFFFSIVGPERWMAFTYPATPLILLGEEDDNGWRRYRFTVCAPRNWYFFVPPRTTSFAVRFETALADDVIRLDINAPDRTMAILYDRKGELEIPVPEGLDGRIWHLRPSVASAARLVTLPEPNPRYQDIAVTLDLRGVADGLSPTWEQWFDPEQPVVPHNRPRAARPIGSRQ